MQQIRRAIARVGAAISRIGLWLSILCLAGMLMIIVLAIVGRFLGLWAIIGADEIAGYLMVALVFFGFAHTVRAGGFIRVDALLKRASGWRRRALEAVLHLIALAFVCLLVFHLWRFVAESYRFEVTSIGLLRIPLYVPQVVLVLGALALALQTLASLLDRLMAPVGEAAVPEHAPTEI